jgi:hypothetical protein
MALFRVFTRENKILFLNYSDYHTTIEYSMYPFNTKTRKEAASCLKKSFSP